MAKTYTIEEASDRLGIPLDEFKRRWKTEWTSLRTFRDSGTVRFRAADIDELARTLGMASDPGVQLAAPASPDQSSTEYLLPDEPMSTDDIFSPSTPPSPAAGRPADSDVRLEADTGRKSSGKLQAAETTPTEELSLDLALPEPPKKAAGPSSIKLTAPKTGSNLSKSSGKLQKETDSSEFELNLDADSDSFDLELNPDRSDEIDLTGSSAPVRAGQSGINLGKPADSGVSLEDSDEEYELSLDPPPVSGTSGRLAGPKSAKMPREELDQAESEFELNLEESSSEIESLAASAEASDFETDFELPAEDSDSGSEVAAVENADTDLENSDFDLALDESDISAEDESASQVVLLDDDSDESAPPPRVRRRPAEDDEAIELDEETTGAVRSAAIRRRRDEEDYEDEPSAVSAAVAKPQPWGALPAAVLIPAFILTFLGGLMSYELVRGMYAYSSGSKPTGTLVRGVAGLFDMAPKD